VTLEKLNSLEISGSRNLTLGISASPKGAYGNLELAHMWNKNVSLIGLGSINLLDPIKDWNAQAGLRIRW
jgi:hypothetical protein